MKHKITTDGITDGIAPFEVISYNDPFKVCIIEFFQMLKNRNLPTPIDLVCTNGENEIVIEYSFLEDDIREDVQLIFKVEKLNQKQ